MADVAIIGAGSWGIALAKVLHTNGNKVTVWSIVEDEITMLKEKHEHVQKLPGVKLPEDMVFAPCSLLYSQEAQQRAWRLL